MIYVSHVYRRLAGRRQSFASLFFDDGLLHCWLVSLAEIKNAVDALSPAELTELAAWFAEKRELVADAAFEDAVRSGKFDAMAEQAVRDHAAGKTRPLDELLDRS